jgi:methionyl-tRNA formyltransferase
VRIAFLGTPRSPSPPSRRWSPPTTSRSWSVLTNPDRPKGRSRTPWPPRSRSQRSKPTGCRCGSRGPKEVLDELQALDLDAAAVVAYGALLPRSVLDAGGRGFVNLHFSLLPRWRGAAPVQHAIRAGDEVSGVTTFVLDEGMDTGPILDQVEVGIGAEESAGHLLARLAELGRTPARRLGPSAGGGGGADPAAARRGHPGPEDHPRRRRDRLVGAGPSDRRSVSAAPILPREPTRPCVARA